MSDEAKQPLDERQRAIRVLRMAGRAPVELHDASDEEIAALAALVDEHGTPTVPNVMAAWREWRAAYAEARKATEDEDDEPTEIDSDVIVKAVSTQDDGSE